MSDTGNAPRPETAHDLVVISCTVEAKAAPYAAALHAVGVAPEAIRVVTPQSLAPADAATLAASAAGLLLCGGPDLDPRFYGEEPREDAGLALAPARDAVEVELLAGARAARTPLLAICRGLQMVNAFLGGTLWQDLPSMLPSPVTHQVPEPLDALAHPIEVGPGGGELGAILRRDPRVNSRHHQAIKDLAPGLEAVAVAPDGVVEAITGTAEGWWLWGVQWHPENLVATHAPQRELFVRFAERVAKRAGRLREGEPALR